MGMAGRCPSRFHPDRRTNGHVHMPCLMICHTHQHMSSAIMGLPRTNSVKISGASNLVLSSRQGKMIEKSPARNRLQVPASRRKSIAKAQVRADYRSPIREDSSILPLRHPHRGYNRLYQDLTGPSRVLKICPKTSNVRN